jgi:putative transcriptional regulator
MKTGETVKSEIIPPGGYLSNRLLVATPLVGATAFARTVIMMFTHDKDGAMGIIVNHVIENIGYKDLFKQLEIDSQASLHHLPVHYGGPLEINRGFVIYNFDDCPHPETLLTVSNIAVSSSVNMLRDIAHGKGPRERILALGYAAWGAGQLEAEMESNSWISVPATRNLIFGADNSVKWKSAAESCGIDISRIATHVGHA